MNVLPCNVFPKQVDVHGAVLTRFLSGFPVGLFSRKTLDNLLSSTKSGADPEFQ